MTGLGKGALVEVARRPRLWATALGQCRALAGPKWWAHWPPVPVPDPVYMAFRLQTMYGSPDATVSPAELVAYLEWCRRVRALAR